MCAHTWKDPEIYQIWTVNQANQNDWPKETWKKCPIKVIQTAMRVQLRDSPSESACVSIHTYCTLLPPNKYFTGFTTFRLCGNSFLQSWRPGPLPLINGLLARIWCSHRCNPTSVSGWESKPFGSCCRLRSPWPGIQPTSPALQGGFLTTGPPGKSHKCFLYAFEVTLIRNQGRKLCPKLNPYP